MTTLLPSIPLAQELLISCHDRVRVPDGRIGEVVGFYKREVAAVLVSFSAGTTAEFPMADVEAL
jgi:hypothetical protein